MAKKKKSPAASRKKAHQPANDPEVKKSRSTALGIFLIFCGVFMLGSFASYLWHWQADQSAVQGSFFELMSNPKFRVNNLFGKVGAALGHQFIYNWFGVAAFLLCWFLILSGLRLSLHIKVKNWPQRLASQLFLLIWFPIFFSFLFGSQTQIMGGANGYYTESWLSSIFGGVGVTVVLLFSVLIFLALRFKWTPEKIRAFVARFTGIKLPRIPSFRKKAAAAHNSAPEATSAPEPEPEQHPAEAEAQQESATKDDDFEIEEPVPEPELKVNEEDAAPDEEDTQKQQESGEEETADSELEIEQREEEEELSEKEVNRKVKEFGEYDPKLDLSRFKLPTVDLLKDYGTGNITINQEELEANKNRIVDTLNNYNIEISKIKATIGPTVTLYEIIPAAGVRISKIKNLEDDIALSLAALGIRIIAPIPGRGTIGIEVPNTSPQMVPMRNLIVSEKFQKTDMELPIALGKTISNETLMADLAKMPHMLMAGATGQGKSVGLNVILTSLLYKKHPSQVKFILVDPKKVELTLFNKIERHYLAKLPDTEEAIITENQKVINTLNSLCIEMDDRYNLLKNAYCRNIKEYNTKFVNRRLNPEEGHRYLPYIVLVIDEFADLIMTAGKEVETPIARLAQLARAIGIHLIIATQRPSVNVITGVIKANFPARVAFRVSSKIDSRTILDAGGAEQLIGKGDMLFHMGQDLVRVQCAFVDTPEVEDITEYIGSQQGYPEAYQLPEYVGEEEDGGGKDILDPSERDALFEDAARLLVTHQQGSTSLLQRKLKLGYNRAGRIIDQLEAAGVIGPFEGSKARQVLVKDETSLEQLLNDENN